MTTLIEQLESLALAVDEGLICREEAIACLVEWRGLTTGAAAAFIDEWPEANARQEAYWRHIGNRPQS
ncbi:hypothetical protein [Kribbella sp. NPDC000426]|uniref:hypothetical protein n=1 Tax=Kribbella sp. NPDC000426 TaxID=3154255 RepID=UPI00331653B0